MLTQQRLKSVAGVLGSAVGVVEQSGRGTAPSSGHLKGLDGQGGGESLTHRPADNPPGVGVHDGRQVEPAFPCADRGDIRNPALIGGEGLKILIQNYSWRSAPFLGLEYEAFFVDKGDLATPGHASIGRSDGVLLSGLERVKSSGSSGLCTPRLSACVSG